MPLVICDRSDSSSYLQGAGNVKMNVVILGILFILIIIGVRQTCVRLQIGIACASGEIC